MKKLLPSLKEKKRYIAFKIESESGTDFQKGDIIRAIESSCKNFLGEISYGKSGINVVKDLLDPKNNFGVVKVNNKYLNSVKGGLILIDKINGKRVIFKNVNVSGSLRKIKSNFESKLSLKGG